MEVREITMNIDSMQKEMNQFTKVAEVEALMRDFKTDMLIRTEELKQQCTNLDLIKVEKETIEKSFCEIRKVQESISSNNEHILKNNLIAFEKALNELGKDFDKINLMNKNLNLNYSALIIKIEQIESKREIDQIESKRT